MKQLLQTIRSLGLVLLLMGATILPAIAQTATVRGRVVDAGSGESLPNANVAIKELNRGAAADADGNYAIQNVPPGTYTLEASFVGFKRFSQRITVGTEGLTVNISMETSSVGLDELVVTGYGVQPKREITGAMSQIKSEAIENLPVESLDKALQGRAAGVQVISQSGAPGGGTRVRIRGDGSINAGNAPLYVIDGVQVGDVGLSAQAQSNALNGLNPNDILSIEILKDAAAASIYGAQAANGVVLITTKQGRVGNTRITVGSQAGVVEKLALYDLLDGPQFVNLMIEAYENQARVQAQNVDAARNLAMTTFIPGCTTAGLGTPACNPNTVPSYDWASAVYQTGASMQHDISVSGGTNETKYYASASYEQVQGQVIRSDFKRMAFRSNLDHRVNSRLSLESRIGMTSTRQFGTITDGNFTNGPFYQAINTRPTEPIYNPDGTYNESLSVATNIVQYMNLENRNARTNQVISNVGAIYRVSDLFVLRAFGGLDFKQVRDSNFRPPEIPASAAVGGSKSEANREVLNYNLNATLSYNQNLDNRHTLNGLLGAEYKHETQETFATTGQGFPSGLFSTLDLAATPTAVSGFFTEYKMASLFGQMKYSFSERYMLSGTLRYDGSSRFGASKRFGLFYAVSGAWNIAREPFFPSNEVFTDLKLRASYGITGNSRIGNFDSRSLFGAGGSYLNQPGIRASQLGNNILTWEEAHTIDFGLDYAFWDGRITGAFDVFRRDNKSLLLNRSLPNDSGFGSIRENAGIVRNEGVELEISSVNVDRGDFTWSSSFNITFLRDELIALNEGQTRIGNTVIVGESLGFYWGYKWAGVNPADGRNMWYDANGNITYSPVADDQQIIGNYLPNSYGGLTNTLSYKGLTADVFFQFNVGQDAYNQHYAASMWDPSRQRGASSKLLDRWTTPGQITDVPKVYRSLNEPGMGPVNLGSSRYIEDVSFVRLKNLTLSYLVPRNLTQRMGLHDVKIFATGYNLVTWTRFSGLDPEIDGNQDSIYPQSRQYRGGIQLSF